MLETAIGEIKLMAPPDYPCMVINARNGYVRNNSSWIIGRIMRDFESWMDDGKRDGPIRTHLQEMIRERWGPTVSKYTAGAGLCVSIYKADLARPGYPGYDLVYFLGFATAAVQLGVAAIPWGIFGDWSVFLVAASGILLVLATGSISQWRKEKWHCRRHTSNTVILTKGHGSQHAIVIIGDAKGLSLEDLAADAPVPTSYGTRFAVRSLAILWIFLLITAAGIKQNTWFLLAIGGLGILNNTFVAGARRHPRAFGVPLIFVGVIGKPRIMDTLFEVEEAYPRVGRSMLDTLWPGKLRPHEQEKWKELEELAQEKTANRDPPHGAA
jgi:hypothetical protein